MAKYICPDGTDSDILPRFGRSKKQADWPPESSWARDSCGIGLNSGITAPSRADDYHMAGFREFLRSDAGRKFGFVIVVIGVLVAGWSLWANLGPSKEIEDVN